MRGGMCGWKDGRVCRCVDDRVQFGKLKSFHHEYLVFNLLKIITKSMFESFFYNLFLSSCFEILGSLDYKADPSIDI